jgi:Predicted transmembrane transcriptional regulator (anti-sigma factor)
MIDFTCDQFKELMFDYIDGELSSDEALQFENHLKNCGGDCSNEFEKLKKMMDSIKASRYVTGNELYAALVPQIEIESKSIRHNNMLRNIRMYGSVAVAAVIMIVMLVYFMPMADIMQESTAQNSKIADEIQVEEYAIAAEIAEEIKMAKDAGKISDRVCYDEEAEMAPSATPFALPGEAVPAGEAEMSKYLKQYAPEYIDTAESLYISYDDVNLPDGIVTVEVIGKAEYSVYVINRFSNVAFDVGDATEFAHVYNVAVPDKPYLIIISFNSDNK